MEGTRELFGRIIAEEDGQGMIEYALIAALVGVLLIVALTTLKDKVGGTFDKVGTSLGS